MNHKFITSYIIPNSEKGFFLTDEQIIANAFDLYINSDPDSILDRNLLYFVVSGVPNDKDHYEVRIFEKQEPLCSM